MKKEDLLATFKMVKNAAAKNSPKILTGIGLVGMVTATVLAVKATPKAMKLIEEEKLRQNEKLCEDAVEKGQMNVGRITKLKPIDVVKVAWKPYVPALVTGAVSIGCVVGASSVSARRQAALYSAYKLSETAFSEYKEKVAETVSDKKVKEIKQKIAADKVEEATSPGNKSNVIVLSEDGDAWFIDPFSNTTFKSSKNRIEAAANRVSRSMIYDMSASLSDFYDELGLEHTATSDSIGWHIDKGTVDMDFSDAVVKGDRAYIVMDFLVKPTYGYDDPQWLHG